MCPKTSSFRLSPVLSCTTSLAASRSHGSPSCQPWFNREKFTLNHFWDSKNWNELHQSFLGRPSSNGAQHRRSWMDTLYSDTLLSANSCYWTFQTWQRTDTVNNQTFKWLRDCWDRTQRSWFNTLVRFPCHLTCVTCFNAPRHIPFYLRPDEVPQNVIICFADSQMHRLIMRSVAPVPLNHRDKAFLWLQAFNFHLHAVTK